MGNEPVSKSTAGHSANLTPDQLDSVVQDVQGMIDAARRAALAGDPDAVAHLLELAGSHLENEVIPATMAAAAVDCLDAPSNQPAGTILVDGRRFYGALRILDDAILAADVREEEAGALSLVTDALRDAADPGKLGN